MWPFQRLLHRFQQRAGSLSLSSRPQPAEAVEVCSCVPSLTRYQMQCQTPRLQLATSGATRLWRDSLLCVEKPRPGCVAPQDGGELALLSFLGPASTFGAHKARCAVPRITSASQGWVGRVVNQPSGSWTCNAWSVLAAVTRAKIAGRNQRV